MNFFFDQILRFGNFSTKNYERSQLPRQAQQLCPGGTNHCGLRYLESRNAYETSFGLSLLDLSQARFSNNLPPFGLSDINVADFLQRLTALAVLQPLSDFRRVEDRALT